MKDKLKYFYLLVILMAVLIGLGLILNSLIGLNITFSALLAITVSFSVISFISLLIFLKGRKKKEKDQAMYTFVAISLKFLMELIMALLWFAVAKKSSMPFILLFFVLYLSFSIFLIVVILNELKNKSL
jgi:hypothetical protein